MKQKQQREWKPTKEDEGGAKRNGGHRDSASRHVAAAGHDAGQATAEYALVMLAAAGLAGLVLAWAVGTDAVGRLMDTVVDTIIADATR